MKLLSEKGHRTPLMVSQHLSSQHSNSKFTEDNILFFTSINETKSHARMNITKYDIEILAD